MFLARLPLPLRFALRELRAGARGFGIFLACLALGVMAIAGVDAVSKALSDGLAREGRAINGGDIDFSLIGREATAAERDFLAGEGRLDIVLTLRAMARTADGRTALVEIKAVEPSYPLAGKAELAGGAPLQEVLAAGAQPAPAVAEDLLFSRLDLKPGEGLTIGDLPVKLADRLTSEPDKLSGGLGFGPRLMLTLEAARATGLIQPGALLRWHYRLSLPPGSDLQALKARANAAFPQAGWEIRTRDNASPELGRAIERFTMFLTLVGLTALLVGGVGVANAVRAFVERQRNSIATLKSLGASGNTVVAIYLCQTLILAGFGILIGLAAGALLPFAIAAGAADLLPLPIEPTLSPSGLALAFLYGLLTALAFSLWPLGRARDIGVSALFRESIAPQSLWPRPAFFALAALPTLALVALAILTAADRRVALVYVGAALGAFLLLRLVAVGLMALARRLPRPRGMELRLALSNIHRPGAATPSVVLSLGLGLCLLVALTLIDGNIRRQLAASLPAKAPSFFFLDIRDREAPAFDAFVKTQAPDAKLERVPMLRGRILAMNGVPVEKITPPSDLAWVLNGDRGITFADKVPEGSSLAAGQWWDAAYQGPPLVSVEKGVADGFGLHVGDSLTVNVLGRNIEARIGAIRKVEWQTLGINFVMVFSPSTFRGAPISHIATLSWPEGAGSQAELGLSRAMAQAFPTITTVRVKEALESFARLAEQLALAIRGAAAIALAASVLVLAGALAAGHRSRLYDAVVLKVLGATRGRILLAFIIEYGLLGLATALFGVLAGTACAWLIVATLMDFSFTLLPGPALIAAFGAMALTIGFGLIGTWHILGQKPAAHLGSL